MSPFDPDLWEGNHSPRSRITRHCSRSTGRLRINHHISEGHVPMSHILLLKSLKSPCFAPSGSWVVAHPLQTRARAPETKLRWRSAGLVRVSNKTLQNARKMELSRDWMITKMLMWATEVGMQSTTTVTMETYIIVKTHFKLWASFPLQKSAWVLFRQSLAGSAGALFLVLALKLWSSWKNASKQRQT